MLTSGGAAGLATGGACTAAERPPCKLASRLPSRVSASQEPYASPAVCRCLADGAQCSGGLTACTTGADEARWCCGTNMVPVGSGASAFYCTCFPVGLVREPCLPVWPLNLSVPACRGAGCSAPAAGAGPGGRGRMARITASVGRCGARSCGRHRLPSRLPARAHPPPTPPWNAAPSAPRRQTPASAESPRESGPPLPLPGAPAALGGGVAAGRWRARAALCAGRCSVHMVWGARWLAGYSWRPQANTHARCTPLPSQLLGVLCIRHGHLRRRRIVLWLGREEGNEGRSGCRSCQQRLSTAAVQHMFRSAAASACTACIHRA